MMRLGPQKQVSREREKGFEPSTSTLARLHSTAELLPRKDGVSTWPAGVCQVVGESTAGPRA